MTSETFNVILHQLSPYVGERMARTILTLHCQGIGITPDELSQDHVGELSQRLATALKVFLGTTRASALVQRIQEAG